MDFPILNIILFYFNKAYISIIHTLPCLQPPSIWGLAAPWTTDLHCNLSSAALRSIPVSSPVIVIEIVHEVQIRKTYRETERQRLPSTSLCCPSMRFLVFLLFFFLAVRHSSWCGQSISSFFAYYWTTLHEVNEALRWNRRRHFRRGRK